MKILNYIVIFVVAILATAMVYLHTDENTSSNAFIYNQKVFQQFRGTIVVEEKMRAVEQADKKITDSLQYLIERNRYNLDLIANLEGQLRTIRSKHQQMSEQFTSEVWKYINDGVVEYGQLNKYEFIYGASGNGNLMYAAEKNDITQDVVQFLNAKYEGEQVSDTSK